MKLSLITIPALASLVALVAVACGDEDPVAPSPGDDGGVSIADAGREEPTPPTDAGGPEAGAKACSDDGFCPTVLPGKYDLRGVWGDGQGAVWSVSDEGAILRWNGAAWIVHASGLGPLRAVWGSGPTDVWVGGERGLYRGRGASAATLAFEPVALPDTKTKIVSLWGAGPEDVWAVGAHVEPDSETPRVLHYTGPRDAGSSFVVDAASNRGIDYVHVWGNAQTGVWLAGSRPQPPPDDYYSEIAILRQRPGTATWTEVTLDTDPDEDPTFGRLTHFGGATIASDTEVFVLGNLLSNRVGVWRANVAADAGAPTFRYERIGPAGSKQTFAAGAFSATDVWAAGEYGRVRHWDGKTWEQAALATTKFPVVNDFHGLWVGPGQQLWIVGDEIALRRGVTK